ncbi:MAG: hypothetical protein OEX19_15630, partial [Gammaproteobacteria bacterium]|nr:hypothetical protein [Gammaproteobacteria bacterium]
MKHLTKTLTVSGLLLTSLGWASTTLAESSIEIGKVADAMGGGQRLLSLSNQMVSANLTGSAPLQAPVPGGEPEKFDNIAFTMNRAL